jgi:hypothetical protein
MLCNRLRVWGYVSMKLHTLEMDHGVSFSAFATYSLFEGRGLLTTFCIDTPLQSSLTSA